MKIPISGDNTPKKKFCLVSVHWGRCSTCKQINKPENICLKFCPLTSKTGSGRLDSEKRNDCENRGFAKSLLK